MENTIENNRLIAEFMGWKKMALSNAYERYPDGTYDSLEILMPNEFKYHNDWNWLMPVVEKIVNDNSVRILIDTNGVKDSIAPYINSVRPIKQALMRANFKGIYEGVLQFIKWYNSNQPPTINQ